jgi:hypothetical protein
MTQAVEPCLRTKATHTAPDAPQSLVTLPHDCASSSYAPVHTAPPLHIFSHGRASRYPGARIARHDAPTDTPLCPGRCGGAHTVDAGPRSLSVTSSPSESGHR